jgi:predicted N-acetyltransferase YhbS
MQKRGVRLNKPNVIVRLANEKDVPAIYSIMQEAFAYYATKTGISNPGMIQALNESCEDIAEQLNQKTVFVAELDGKVVGSVRVECMKDGTAYFSRFGVDKHYKSSGVGCALMVAVDEYMEASGMGQLMLHTASCLLSLVRFYYSKGFVIVSTDTERGYSRALLCKSYASSVGKCAVN